MAVWQVNFSLISENLKENFKEVVPSESCVEHLTKDSVTNVSEVLPKGKSWTEDLIVYGNIDSTCVLLVHKEGSLRRVSVRFDVRTLRKEELISIVDFINTNKLKIIHDNKVIEPTIGNIVQIIKDSDALKFCKNPHQYISGLNKVTTIEDQYRLDA